MPKQTYLDTSFCTSLSSHLKQMLLYQKNQFELFKKGDGQRCLGHGREKNNHGWNKF